MAKYEITLTLPVGSNSVIFKAENEATAIFRAAAVWAANMVTQHPVSLIFGAESGVEFMVASATSDETKVTCREVLSEDSLPDDMTDETDDFLNNLFGDDTHGL